MEKMIFDDIGKYVRPVKADANKGTCGLLSVVAGSRTYRGAADLAVSGALRAGAGIVRLISVEEVTCLVSIRHPSATFLTVRADSDGFIFASEAEKITLSGKKSSAFLIGPGLGRSEGAKAALDAVFEAGIPTVADADALNIIPETPEVLKCRRFPLIVTPHIGEMSRLTGKDADYIKKHRSETAAEFSLEYNCVTVLKDNVTVVSDENGNVYETVPGSAGLAKGGSGDVLAGIIAGLLASGHGALEAALGGTLVHSLASVKCAEEYGVRGMLPSDLDPFIAKALREYGI